MQETLFPAHVYAFDKQPSDRLRKRAEKFVSFDVKRFGGYILRKAHSTENSVLRKALLVPATAEMIAEIPLLVAALAIRERRQHKFAEQLTKEFPLLCQRHGFDESGILPIRRYALRNGTPNQYADAILTTTRNDTVQSLA